MDNPNSKQSQAAARFPHPIIHLMRWHPNQVRGLQMLMDWAKLGNLPRILEVGSYTGESAVIMKQHKQYADITCIDKWDDPLPEHYFDMRATAWGFTKHKSDSQTAASTYHNQEFDLIYIDASHEYGHVLADIRAYLPKVKAGGVLAGHDYSNVWPGVQQAVNETFGQPHQTFADHSWAIRKERT